MWGGAAVLRASGASLVAGGPTRGLTEQGPTRVGASRLVLWGESRRHPSRPIGAEKIAVVLFKPELDTGARGPWLSGPPRPGSESFQQATAVTCGTAAAKQICRICTPHFADVGRAIPNFKLNFNFGRLGLGG